MFFLLKMMATGHGIDFQDLPQLSAGVLDFDKTKTRRTRAEKKRSDCLEKAATNGGFVEVSMGFDKISLFAFGFFLV